MKSHNKPTDTRNFESLNRNDPFCIYRPQLFQKHHMINSSYANHFILYKLAQWHSNYENSKHRDKSKNISIH